MKERKRWREREMSGKIDEWRERVMGRKKQRVVGRRSREGRKRGGQKQRERRGGKRREREILKIPLCSKFLYFMNILFPQIVHLEVIY